MLTTRAPARTARAALAWTPILICALYAGFALFTAAATVLAWLGQRQP